MTVLRFLFCSFMPQHNTVALDNATVGAHIRGMCHMINAAWSALLILAFLAVMVFVLIFLDSGQLLFCAVVGVSAGVLAVWLKNRTPGHVKRLLKKHHLE